MCIKKSKVGKEKLLKNKKVLINSYNGLGDTILSLILVRYLKKHFNCRITFIINKHHKPLVEGCTSIEKVWEFDEKQFHEPQLFVDELKKGKFDCVFSPLFQRIPENTSELKQFKEKSNVFIPDINDRVTFHYFFDTAFLEADIPVRVGAVHIKDKTSKHHNKEIFNYPIPFLRHEIESVPFILNLFRIFPALGLECDIYFNEILALNTLPIPKIKNKFAVDPNRYTLILHPGSVTGIRWPMEYYLEFCNCSKNLPIQIFVTGNEKEKLEGDFSKFSHVTDIRGKLSLEELMVFIHESDAFLSTSTGPSHIASAYNTQTFTIFTNNFIQTWKPLNRAAEIFLPQKKCLFCSIARENLNIGNCKCLSYILPKEIYKLIEIHVKKIGKYAKK